MRFIGKFKNKCYFMSKTKKIIIAILVVLLMGFGLYSAFRISFYGAFNNDPNDYENDGKSCDRDKNCLLISTNLGCADCDYADSSWRCLSQEKRLEIRRERQDYMSNEKDLSCAKCMPSDSSLMFRCVCENGECVKTASCDVDEDCNNFPDWSEDHKCIDNQCRYVEK